MGISKWPKCSKCRKRNVEIIEVWTGSTIVWQPGDRQDSGMLDPGDADPYRVEGHCLSCGHRWKMRGIAQVQEEWFEGNDENENE